MLKIGVSKLLQILGGQTDEIFLFIGCKNAGIEKCFLYQMGSSLQHWLTSCLIVTAQQQPQPEQQPQPQQQNNYNCSWVETK